jgi:hypothetical protein
MGGWRSGSAVRLHRKGHRFESYTTHHFYLKVTRDRVMVARLAHNQEIIGSNPVPATKTFLYLES